MNEQFKCPNCGENSMHIVKTYKMTDSDNYIKCGRCLHVWMQSKHLWRQRIKDAIFTVAMFFSFMVLMFAYCEKNWVLYVMMILFIGMSSLTNYLIYYQKK